MQTSAQPQAAPAPAAAPAASAPVVITTTGADGKSQTIAVPSTQDEVSALIARREALSDQLQNVSQRRSDLAQEIAQTAVDAARVGLQDRLRVLDSRILQLESDLAVTGRQLSLAPAEFTSSHPAQNQGGGGDWEEGLMVGSGFTLLFGTLLIFARRRWWRRRYQPRTELGNESSRRLERLEQGMEAIAIEIERVSEGQRFVTKLLSESQGQLSPANRLPKSAAMGRDDPASS